MPDSGWAIVYNPTGGGSDALEDVRRVLEERTLGARWYPTTEDEPGDGLARKAIEDGASLVIAAGGDGTVRATAEGLLESESEVPLGLIPLGTGNVLARDLGIPDDVEDSIEVLSTGAVRRIDVGLADGEPFVGMAGVGLAARMVRDSDPEMKSTIGPLAYLASAIRNLWKPRFQVELTLGSGDVERRMATLVLVGTAGVAPGGLSPFPDSEPGDGLLRVLIVDAYGLSASLRALGAVVLGRPHELVERHVARVCVAETHTPQPFELNGEARPETTRVRFHVRPQALRVVVPRIAEEDHAIDHGGRSPDRRRGIR